LCYCPPEGLKRVAERKLWRAEALCSAWALLPVELPLSLVRGREVRIQIVMMLGLRAMAVATSRESPNLFMFCFMFKSKQNKPKKTKHV